jgi:hypothetical protein
MAYIFGLIIVGLFFLTLHYYTELNKSQKIIVTSIVFFIIIGAVTYNKYNTMQREKMLDVVRKFEQGKTVNCNGVDVNSTYYTLSIGTYTFIGKKNTPHYAEMISASTCK